MIKKGEKMNLDMFDLDYLLLTAIKSEIESKELYTKMANTTQNGLLQDKLKFLAEEEEKHRLFIEEIYRNHFPDNKIIIPEKTKVPLPEVEYNEDTPMSVLLNQAMDAEKAASTFYLSLADRFEEGTKMQNTLLYFSDMEIGHYKILEMEKQSMERFEESDIYWPMVHVGP